MAAPATIAIHDPGADGRKQSPLLELNLGVVVGVVGVPGEVDGDTLGVVGVKVGVGGGGELKVVGLGGIISGGGGGSEAGADGGEDEDADNLKHPW